MNKIQDTIFHSRYEELTEQIYSDKEMLPARYVFVLTNLCNLNCPFCYQSKIKEDAYTTTNDWLSLVEQIPKYARITLTGGEPLVFAGFENVFSKVATNYDCNLITNGLLLDKKTIKLLLSFQGFKVLSISIDDIGNKTRNFTERQWSKLKDNIKEFLKIRNELKHKSLLDIKTMVLDDNADELFNIHRFCIEILNCDSHVFQFLKGSPIQHADHMYSFEDIIMPAKPYIYEKWNIIIEQLELVRKYNLKNNINSFLHPKVANLNSEEKLQNIDYINKSLFCSSSFQACKFPWSSVHVNCDGNLFPCLAVAMGNVKDSTLKEIINGGEMTKFRDMIRKSGTLNSCSRCGWLRPLYKSEGKL